jgi:hypothetical protein
MKCAACGVPARLGRWEFFRGWNYDRPTRAAFCSRCFVTTGQAAREERDLKAATERSDAKVEALFTRFHTQPAPIAVAAFLGGWILVLAFLQPDEASSFRPWVLIVVTHFVATLIASAVCVGNMSARFGEILRASFMLQGVIACLSSPAGGPIYLLGLTKFPSLNLTAGLATLLFSGMAVVVLPFYIASWFRFIRKLASSGGRLGAAVVLWLLLHGLYELFELRFVGMP